MATSGNKRRFYIVKDGNVFSWLKGEQSNSFSIECETIEATDKSSEWRQFVSGIKGATAEASVFADSNSEEQNVMLRALYRGETVTCFIGTVGEGNEIIEGDMFDALISSISTPNEIGSIVTRSISLQVTGEVAHYPEFE